MTDYRLSRRQFLKIAGLALGGATLMGCAELARLTTASPREPIQLQIMASEEELPDHLIEQFQDEFKGIQILRLAPDQTAMMHMVAAGEALDVFHTRANRFPWLARRGLCLDITEYVAGSARIHPEDLFPVTEYCVWNGRWYGLVSEWSPDFLVWVNKRLWNEAGVPLSEGDNLQITLAEWRNLSAKLSQRSSGRQVIGTDFEIDLFGLFWLASTINPPIAFFSSDGARMILATQPVFVDLVRWVEEWKLEGGLPVKFHSLALQNTISCACTQELKEGLPETLTYFVSGSSSAQDWLQGQAAATLQGVGFGRKIISGQVKEEDILVLPAPGYGSRDANPSVKASAMGISSASSQPESAWLFLEWYTIGEPSKERTRHGTGLPARRDSLPAFPQEKPWEKQLYDTCVHELKRTRIVTIPLSALFDPEGMRYLWNQQEELFLRRQKSLEIALVDFESQVNQASEV